MNVQSSVTKTTALKALKRKGRRHTCKAHGWSLPGLHGSDIELILGVGLFVASLPSPFAYLHIDLTRLRYVSSEDLSQRKTYKHSRGSVSLSTSTPGLSSA